MTKAGLDLLGGDPDEALRQMLARAGGQPFLLTAARGAVKMASVLGDAMP
jgi:hypothetical protein